MKIFYVLATGIYSLAVYAASLNSSTAETKIAQIKEVLTPLLSENATIIYPDSEQWYDVTHRAAAPRVHPGYLAVVEVAAKEDVANTVWYWLSKKNNVR